VRAHLGSSSWKQETYEQKQRQRLQTSLLFVAGLRVQLLRVIGFDRRAPDLREGCACSEDARCSAGRRAVIAAATAWVWVSGDFVVVGVQRRLSFPRKISCSRNCFGDLESVFWDGRGPLALCSRPLFNQSLAYGGTNDSGLADLFLSAPSAPRRSWELAESTLVIAQDLPKKFGSFRSVICE